MSKLAQWFKQELPEQKYNAMFGGGYLRGYHLHYKMQKFSTKNLTATIQSGATINSYISAGRVLGGGLLFGVIGAAVGAMVRKGGTQLYVVVEQDGVIIGTLQGPAEKEADARKLVAGIEASRNDPNNT